MQVQGNKRMGRPKKRWLDNIRDGTASKCVAIEDKYRSFDKWRMPLDDDVRN